MNTNLVSTEKRLSFEMQVERGFNQIVGMPGHTMDPSLMMLRADLSPAASDYRTTAIKLLDTRSASSTSRIFVTSPGQGDGKTCTAFNLAWAFAGCGKSVLLIELNFAKPRFRAALGNLQIRYGLDTALRGQAVPADTVISEVSSGLHIVAIREATPSDKLAHLLSHLNAFLDWASENYEMLVIDCPPVNSREWNDWFRNFIGPALLVVRKEHTPLVEVKRAVKLLGEHLMSVVLNGTHGTAASAFESLPEEEIAPVSREIGSRENRYA